MGLLQNLITTTFLVLFLNSTSSLATNSTSGNVSSWCNQTPYPSQCEHYLTIYQKSSSFESIRGRPDFLNMVLGSALRASLDAQNTVLSLGPKCEDAKQKAAWSDCLELFEVATERLNQIVASPGLEHDDSQTWLSSVLTHYETCKSGFEDLGANSDQLLPLMGYPNITYLISNALAINNQQTQTRAQTQKRATTATPYKPALNGFKAGFPRWVKGGDRRLLQSFPTTNPDLVVAQDGSGDYQTVADAVASVANDRNSGRTVIYVKAGEYKEYLSIKNKNVMLSGDGIGKTIISGSKSVGGGSTTFSSATVAVSDQASNFMAKGITFRNTAGPGGMQAVALRSGSDFSVFYQCSFEGYQDTLYAISNRQFYRDCSIYGTVDFIFGNSAAVFQGCNLYPRGGSDFNAITAQGRSDPNENTGFSIISSSVKPAGGHSTPTYLGRPWKEYSRTVYMYTYLDSIVSSAGWAEWAGSFALDTLYYGEYLNTGPKSKTSGRVKWKGFHIITDPEEAEQFTVGSFIDGDSWLPNTGVPFTSGLAA